MDNDQKYTICYSFKNKMGISANNFVILELIKDGSIMYTRKLQATEATTFDYTAPATGEYTWRMRSSSIGATTTQPITYSLDNLSIFYSYPYTIENCDNLADGYRFGFNGKEKESELYGESNAYDFGARIHDARIGRWLSVDPLQAKYPFASPYNYALNIPIQAKAPDGKVVIFVNGMWGKGTGATGGGKEEHWGDWWVNAAQKAIGDYKAIFYDGSADWNYNVGGMSRLTWNFDFHNRYQAGYMKGKTDAAEIINNLERDKNGNITESIKFVTSSMGTSFSRGMSDAIIDYVNTENTRIDAYNNSLEKNKDGSYKNPSQVMKRLDVVIEYSLDLDAFQSASVGADKNSKSNYHMRKENSWAGGTVPGSKEIGKRMEGHHPSWANTKDFPKSTMNPKEKCKTENPTK